MRSRGPFGDKVKVEIETNKSLKSVDPYACAIKIKHNFFDTWLTVGIFQGKYHAIAIFLKEGVNITGHLICTNYKISPIPTGDLEVP